MTSRQLRLTPNLLLTNTLRARIQKEKTRSRAPYSLPLALERETGASWQGVLITPRRQSCPMMFVTEEPEGMCTYKGAQIGRAHV